VIKSIEVIEKAKFGYDNSNSLTGKTNQYGIQAENGMGEVMVPADKYWGAQTERSRNNFKIGPEASMPREIIYAFAYLKKAAALTNLDLGVLSLKMQADRKSCDEILGAGLMNSFPGHLADRIGSSQHECK
jgi:fumarate hydratase class II